MPHALHTPRSHAPCILHPVQAQKTFESKGLAHVSGLVLANARDLLALIRWNARHGIQFFRLSSCIFPWMTKYRWVWMALAWR